MLRDLFIVDLSTHLAGALLSHHLAERGARVVKIENPRHPDATRALGAAYARLMQHKTLVSLDLASPDGQAHLAALLRDAHGLLEAFRPEAKRKLGLSSDALSTRFPSLCTLSLMGFPSTDARAQRAAHDLGFQAITGLLSLQPEMPALPWASLATAHEGALSLLAAIYAARQTGKGTHVELSFVEATARAQLVIAAEFQATQQLPALFTGKFPCYRVYTTADGRRVSVSATQPKFWLALCAALGLSLHAEDAYSEGPRAVFTIAAVQAAFGSQTWAQWAPVFTAEDCCVEPVLEYAEVFGSKLLKQSLEKE